jgi:uncharacterized protein (DUF1810 family)
MIGAHKLQHFVDAQAPVYQSVLAELEGGKKRSHWMWFIFPQLRGLGRSEMAQRYALDSLADARSYLAHPILGARLFECSALVCAIQDRPIAAIFGTPDDMKFHSCMTLFSQARPEHPIFIECLQKYFDGRPDAATLALLAPTSGTPT